MFSPPKTYFEWVNLIDSLEGTSDIEAVLFCLKEGVFEPQAELYKKLTLQLWGAVSSRLMHSAEQLQRDIFSAKGSELQFIQVLHHFQIECQYLFQIIQIPLLREQERKIMKDSMLIYINALQNVLEKNIFLNDRTGKFLTILKKNNLTVSLQELL